MKNTALSVLALLFASAARAQTASPVLVDGAVPITKEFHHKLVLQNEYVRVFNVTVQPHEVTLLHQHDAPYIFLTMGTADVINAVAGKPEAHLMLEDGSTRYTPGGFAHIARTDAGILFRNITIELMKPQAAQINLGDDGKDRAMGSCPLSGDESARQSGEIVSPQIVPCFETSELRMERVRVEGAKEFAQASPEAAALLIAMTDANLDVSIGGKHAAVLHTGDVLWLPAGIARKAVDEGGGKSQFLLISFKDSGAAPAK